MPVSELMQRVSWMELLHWIAFYTWEADQQVPPRKRPIRARTPADGIRALNHLFQVRGPSG